ncbi:MAG TPA: hypothetical protein PKE38_03375 [Ignavibacteriaceae bacterium]|nr:hypothetical protein [Ignavibacteriaceae bacterium]
MKSRMMALAFAIFIVAFTANTTIMAQSNDSKTKDNKIKTTVQKTDTKTNTGIKTNEVKQNAGTTTHHKNHQLKERTNTVKNEVKNNPGKDMNKTNDEVKKNDMITHKTQNKSNTK